MNFKFKVDFVIGSFVGMTLLLAFDLFLLAIFSIRVFFSNKEGFWGAMYSYFFKSWYVGLHVTIIIISIFAFIMLKHLK